MTQMVKTEFVASLADAQGGQKQTVRTRVIWLKDSYPRYRFQVDDNSFFLRDIHQKGYKAIFPEEDLFEQVRDRL